MQERAVTPRAILIGALLIPLNVYWVTVMEVRWYTLDGSCLPLFITPVFFLFTLVVLNLYIHNKGAVHPLYIFFLFSLFDLLWFIVLGYNTPLRLYQILIFLAVFDYFLYILPQRFNLKPLTGGGTFGHLHYDNGFYDDGGARYHPKSLRRPGAPL